jgi:signal transduction histidine kinase
MALVRANEWFAFEVVPAAREGRLDRKTATLLHTESERRALDVEHAIGRALASLTDAQARELENVTRETTRAWIAVGLLSLGGVGLAALVTQRLGKNLVAPFLAVAEAARAFARGEPAVMPTSDDDEIRVVATAFNQMTAQVREAEERRLETGRLAALGEMSAAVAHELLNPLSVVLAEPVLQRPELTAVRAEAEHMKKVVQGLLGFARPATEPVATLDLGDVVKEAVDRAWPFADARNVAIAFGDVHPTTVVASPTAIRQVLDNLIQNAIQASDPDGTIEIHLRSGGVVEVLDRGRGIPVDVRERLYEPFVTGRHEGTGLGLAIASRIVRAQGGTLAHLSREGGGTIARWELNRG